MLKGPPVAAKYEIWVSGLTCAERNERLDAYLAAKKEYRQQVDAYVKEHGYDKLSQEKLRALLAGNLIQSTGGKLIMQWRWEEFCAGRPVLRSKDYLKECPLPEYTRLKPVSGQGFLGLPLNVWEYHIFPFMDDRTLWRVMQTSR